jgi:Ca2+-binding EF-hand superfamily protein
MDERGTNIARILRAYDQDEDGKLDCGELSRAVSAEDALAGHRSGPGEGWTSFLLITPFDLDSDGKLNLSELQAMIQRGKPPLTYTELLQRYEQEKAAMRKAVGK